VITGAGAVFIDKAGRKPLILVIPKHKKSLSSNIYLLVLFIYNIIIVISVSIRYLDWD